MARQPSGREEEQLILCSDVLAKILMDYLEKDQDILNFILASKIYYAQFYDTLLFHNVLRGECTALERAAKTGNTAMMERILDIPIIEKAAPRNIWPRTVNNARAHKDLVELLLQVDCVRASIDEEARENASKGKDIWKEREFEGSWLRVMWNAIKSDQADVVELFLSHGLSVESCDRHGSTALQRAAKAHEKVHLVERLLTKYKVDPNKIDVRPIIFTNKFNSPLFWAAKKGNTEVVKLLLEHKADPCDGQPGRFSRALAAAVFEGHGDIVSILSQDERIELNAHDADGKSVLGYAIKGGKTDVVQMLLGNERIDPNATTGLGISPLMIAAIGVGFGRSSSRLTVTKLLLSDDRVDMFLRDETGRNALFHAACHDQHEVLEMYLKDGRLDPNEADENLNTPVSCTRDEDCLQLLIDDTRVDLNKANNEGMTPLMQNIYWRWRGNVERLLDSGRVDANRTNQQGDTAMMMAISRHNTLSNWEASVYRAIVRSMLHSGRVKLDLVNANGETALMMAVKKEVVDVVKMILATGHRMMDMKDADGVTMIEYAIQNDSAEIVDLLLETGEVKVTRGIIESAQSEDVRDMLVRYKDMMEQRAENLALADAI